MGKELGKETEKAGLEQQEWKPGDPGEMTVLEARGAESVE